MDATKGKILSVTDNRGMYYSIIPKNKFGMMERAPIQEVFYGYYGYIENDIFHPSKYTQHRSHTINYAPALTQEDLLEALVPKPKQHYILVTEKTLKLMEDTFKDFFKKFKTK